MSRYINLKTGSTFDHAGQEYRVIGVSNQFVAGELVSKLLTSTGDGIRHEWVFKEYSGNTGDFPEVRYSHVCGWIYDKGAE